MFLDVLMAVSVSPSTIVSESTGAGERKKSISNFDVLTALFLCVDIANLAVKTENLVFVYSYRKSALLFQ